MGDMMASLKMKMGPDKILLGNNANQEIAKHVFPVMDASMFEHYKAELLSKESLLRDWDDKVLRGHQQELPDHPEATHLQ